MPHGCAVSSLNLPWSEADPANFTRSGQNRIAEQGHSLAHGGYHRLADGTLAMDASSLNQESLPVSSDALLAQLDEWGLAYTLYEHVPLRTVEDAKTVEAEMEVPGVSALRIKNLYLRDRKKRNYLISVEQDREIDLKALGQEIGAPGLSFGSADRLMEFLGIRPGAVSPLAMITGVDKGVIFHFDRAAQDADVICMHPLVNDRTVVMARADVLSFFDRIGVDVNWI
jgi:Ala-tRNA(Pro) deacylase